MAAKDASKPSRRRPRRNKQYSEKRTAILEAAASLFRQRGFAEVSLNDLAEQLSITKPTIYHYVKSKDDLLLQIKLHAQEEVLAFFREIEAGPGSAREKLRAMMLRYAVVMSSDYGACLSLAPHGMEPASRAEIRARNEQGNQAIYRIFAAGRKDGSIELADRAVALHAMFGSLNWIATWYKADGRLSPSRMAEIHVDLLLDGLGGRRAAEA